MHCLPRIAAIDAWQVDGTVKGYPGTAAPQPLAALARSGWNLLAQDLPLPVAVLRASALAHNRLWMRRFLAASGARLCPHGKTTMSPQLFAAQLEDGAFGITCATVSQLQVYRSFGIRRVFMANQVIDRQGLAYVMAELSRDADFELYLIVDSVEGVRRLAAAATAAALARPVRVLAEVGAPGARTGARSLAAAEEILAAIDAVMPRLALHGVEAYEDVIRLEPPARELAMRSMFALLRAVDAHARVRPAAVGATPWLHSAGGSAYFDLVIDELTAGAGEQPATLLLRSGCYITHDHAHYERAQSARIARSPVWAALGEGLRPALEVWCCVQSRPEPGKALLSAGKRDLSFDIDLPRPVGWYRSGGAGQVESLGVDHQIVALNDQHAHLVLPPSSPLAVGDLVCLGISHPCTTFDRWQLLYVVDDDYTVIDAIRTYF